MTPVRVVLTGCWIMTLGLGIFLFCYLGALPHGLVAPFNPIAFFLIIIALVGVVEGAAIDPSLGWAAWVLAALGSLWGSLGAMVGLHFGAIQGNYPEQLDVEVVFAGVATLIVLSSFSVLGQVGRRTLASHR